MVLSPEVLAEARRVGQSLAPPTPEEGAQMRVIWASESVEEARAS